MTGQLKSTQTGTNTLKAAVTARESELANMATQHFPGSAGISKVKYTPPGPLQRKGKNIIDEAGNIMHPRSREAVAFKREEEAVLKSKGLTLTSNGSYVGKTGFAKKDVIFNEIQERTAKMSKLDMARDYYGKLTRKGRGIDEGKFEKILGGGIKGNATRIFEDTKLLSSNAFSKAKNIAKDAYGVSKTFGSKFLGGKTTFKALEGVAEFTKHPVEGIKDMGSALTKIGPKLKTTGSGLIKVFKDPMTFIKDLGPKIAGIGTTLEELIGPLLSTSEGFFALTGVGAIILGIVAVIIIIIKHWKEFKKAIEPGIKTLKDAFKIVKEGVMGAIQPIIDFFGALTNGAGGSSLVVKILATTFNILADTIKILAKVIKFLLVDVVGKGIKLFLGPMLSLIHGVIETIMGVIKLFQKGKFTEGIKQIFDGIAKSIIGLMGPFSSVFSFMLRGLSKLVGALSFLPSWLGGGVAKGAANALKGAADFIDKAKDMGHASGNKLGKAIKAGVKDAEIQEGITNAVGQGLTDSQKAAQDAAKKILKSVMSEIVTGVLDIVKTNISNTVSGITDAMKASKDAAMNVFEQQISTIEKLKKAEDDLTKTKEFELNKRAILDQRAIDHENFTRNKALAIYEGRIDDARSITLDERKSVKDSNKQMETLQDERTKYLADQNLQFMVDSIQEAKKLAGDFYDDAIKSFETAAKKITEFPPTSAQEYKDQLAKLSAAANTEAGHINTSFSGLMTKLETHMTVDLPNKGVAPFGAGMDALVQIAKDKFGLGTTAGDNTTVIGSTISMLSGVQSSITGDTTIGSAVSSLTGGIVTKFADLTPTLTATGGTIPNLMTAISTAITANNPMKAGSAWDAAIDLSITTLMEKYKGEFSVLTTTISSKAEGLQKLIDLYAKVQKLNETTSMSGPVDPLGGGTTDTKIKGLSTGKITDYINTQMKASFTTTHANAVGVLSSAVPDIVISGILLGSIGAGIADYRNVYEKSEFWPEIQAQSIKMYHDVLGKDLKPKMAFANGGYVPGFDSSPMPATLHGGEYVVNAKAVKNIGLSTLQNLNNMRLQSPQYNSPRVTQGASGETSQTVHIHVDNFIGEEAWFEKMMKDYNVKVVPQSQRASGMQNRSVSTYSGLNRGL
jgi:hypothetical protein